MDAMPGALLHLKSFLGVDESLPSGTLPLTNWKHQRSGPDEVTGSWPAAPHGTSGTSECLQRHETNILPASVNPCRCGVPAMRVQLGKYWMLRRADYELLVGMARNDTVE